MTTRSNKVLAALSAEFQPLSKVIAIANQKGGVGKTSSAFNFAHYLNELGYKVLVCDLDGQGNMTELFFEQDVLKNFVHTSAVELFEDEMTEFDFLKHPSGVDLVATTRNCHELTNVDTKSIESVSTFYKNLTLAAAQYDFVVIDTPPAPGVRTTAACASANYIFAPVLVDTFAMPALEGVVNSVYNIGQLIEEDLKIHGILINQLQEGSAETREDLEMLISAIGDALIPTPVRLSKPFRRAQRSGIPVWHLRHSGSEQKTSRETRKAYGEMASRIEEIPQFRIDHFNDFSRAVRAKIAVQIESNQG
tara:strand:+ start:7601 stop:8521 length:921 start_codon:yes stop_codon:yes gene_type:complete